jgi:hypothetical protein
MKPYDLPLSPEAAADAAALREIEIRKLVRRQAAWWRELLSLVLIAAGLLLLRWLLQTSGWPESGHARMVGNFIVLDGLWLFFGLGIWGLVLAVRGIGLFWLDGWIGSPRWEERKVREIVERELGSGSPRTPS